MASKRRRSKSLKEEIPVKRRRPQQAELSLSDVTCPICLSVEIEPVTLPCQHEFCLPCFTDTIFKANKQCPLCRLRVGAWTRTATKESTLVNKNRWDDIRRAFPNEVSRRLSGEDEDISNEYAPPVPRVVVSSPGEIRQEYEEQMRQLADELAQEDRAGEQLARKIEEEERRALEEQRRLEEGDEQLARKIACTDTPSESFCSCPVQSQGDESTDSISPELSYFLPICVAPKTPVTTTMLAPAARAPECTQYQPNFRDAACFAKSQPAATLEAVTDEVTSPHSLVQNQSEEQQTDDDACQRQLEEDFKLAKKIYYRLRKEDLRTTTREDYDLRSRSAAMKLALDAPRRLRCHRLN